MSYSKNKFTRLFLILVALLVLASSMPHEATLPKGIDATQILFTDSTLGNKLQVILTKSDMLLYKLTDSGSYQPILKRTVCQALALSTFLEETNPSKISSNAVLNVAIGCKNGYLNVYEISIENNNIMKSFSKNLNEPINRIISGGKNFPYYLIATVDHIEVYRREDYIKQLEIPITGSLEEMVYQESRDVVVAADANSIIRISMTAANNIQIRRTPRLGMYNERVLQLTIGRRLQDGNTTSQCGNGIVQTGEECDDNNTINDDFCSNNCTTPVCGDGLKAGS